MSAGREFGSGLARGMKPEMAMRREALRLGWGLSLEGNEGRTGAPGMKGGRL
jgi:hypothetical protein